MGRPLLSTLIDSPARIHHPVRVAQPASEPQSPKIDYWSYTNPFDPDSDQFWKAENTIIEEFLPHTIPLSETNSTSSTATVGGDMDGEGAGEAEGEYVRVEVSEIPAIRSRLLRAAQANSIAGDERRGLPAPAESARPELVPSTENDSASSDGMSSGRTSPEPDVDHPSTLAFFSIPSDRVVQEDPLTDLESLQRQPVESARSAPPSPNTQEFQEFFGLEEPAPLFETDELDNLNFDSWFSHNTLDSLPVSPRPRQAEAVPIPLTPPPPPQRAIDIPVSPSSRTLMSQSAAASSPMTPPGSVTPRFLTWGGPSSNAMRPRAVDMSPSPMPGTPFGNRRASRMSLSYISPPAVRALQ